MIYITGDTHIPIDIDKLNAMNFPEQESLTKDDYVIICGDFGLLFNYKETGNSVPACTEDTRWTAKELGWYDWLNERPFTTLWIDGNHENFDRLVQYPVTEWCGGKVQKISDSIIHLMRGQIFEISGFSIFTFGGARSHDRGIATGTEDVDAHRWWWSDEMPAPEEYDEAFSNLERRNGKVDFIITHEVPGNILQIDVRRQNELSRTLWTIHDNTEFDRWYCGHYHKDEEYGKVRMLYRDIIRIGE